MGQGPGCGTEHRVMLETTRAIVRMVGRHPSGNLTGQYQDPVKRAEALGL
jgi:hypothetical protein